MVKIVVIKDLEMPKHQKERLRKLGEVTISKIPNTHDERVDLVSGHDVICSGKFGLKQKYQELNNVFISLPFVGVGFFDKQILKKNNITVSNSPGCNKAAVSEWIIFMILCLLREFNTVINTSDEENILPKVTKGLVGRKICILGKGNIGEYTGEVCKKLGMEVSYFARGDDLQEKTKDSELVVNCLTVNKSTEGLLNNEFFENLRDGCLFLSVVDYITYDIDALIKYLDNGKIVGAALDAMGVQVGDTKDPFYLKIQAHPKILATPHIAWSSNISSEKGGDMMIDNIEAWLKGSPINIIN